MEIRVIDFEIVTRHYKKYRDGVDFINKSKNLFLEKLEPLKTQMNKIISDASNLTNMDENMQKEKANEFQKLQTEAMEHEAQFKYQMKQENDKLNTNSFNELSDIIEEWAKQNSIDLVSGKMEVIYSNPKFDSTYAIVEILKEKDLYVEFNENPA